MSKFTESKIAVEAVKVVEEYGELTMGELIDILIERMQPSGHDMNIIANRNDTYFSQKVRNLRSHSNKVFFNNVCYDRVIDKYVSYEYKKLKNVLDKKVYVEKLSKRKNRAAEFYARKVNFERINKEKKLIGNAGEKLVYNDQIEFVKKYVPEYVKSVRHVSMLDGDGAGYDIRSFNAAEKIIYIEVKSTTGKKETPFYMSASEYAFYELHKEKYVIARVYEFDMSTNTGKIEYISGNNFEGVFDKEASAYKIIYKK